MKPEFNSDELSRPFIATSKQTFSINDRRLIDRFLSYPFEYIDYPLFADSSFRPAQVIIEEQPFLWTDSFYVENNSYKTLTAEEEKEQFILYNFIRKRVRDLQVKKIKPNGRISCNTARVALARIKKSIQLRNTIANNNLGLAFMVCKKFKAKFEHADLYEIRTDASEILLTAVEKFDVSRGFRFSTFAANAIWKNLSRQGMREQAKGQKSCLFSTLENEGKNVFDSIDFRVPQKDIEHETDILENLKIALLNNSASLSDRQLLFIKEKFFVNSESSNVKIGDKLGINRETFRLDLENALRKLKVFLQGDEHRQAV